MTAPYCCPRCFTQSASPDADGACPACGYADWVSQIYLGCGLAGCLFTLLAVTLGALYTYLYTGLHL
jgi:hypothetical protein